VTRVGKGDFCSRHLGSFKVRVGVDERLPYWGQGDRGSGQRLWANHQRLGGSGEREPHRTRGKEAVQDDMLVGWNGRGTKS